jgi:hypothetical protein
MERRAADVPFYGGYGVMSTLKKLIVVVAASILRAIGSVL